MTISTTLTANQRAFEQLVYTVQKLSQALDNREVMRIIRTKVRELTGADGATLVLKEGTSCYYADESAIRPLWKGSRFPMHTCISGWAMIHKEPVSIENIYEDKRIVADRYSSTFVKSLLVAPMGSSEPVGAIAIYWANSHRASREELAALQAIADVTANALEYIRMRDRLEETVKERTGELAAMLEKEKELNEMRSVLLSMASHEIKTPLSCMLSSISLIDDYGKKGEYEKQEKHIERIKVAVRNLNETLDDFLSLDRLEQRNVHAQSELSDMEKFMHDVSQELGCIRKEGQKIRCSHTGEKEVRFDKRLLRNVMLNLLSNAIKYSDDDIELITKVHEDMVCIMVKDKGIGIPEQEQKNMFGKFFRAKNTGDIKGTGLGLHIVHRYVELLNGTIVFSSDENEGSNFMVTFPLL